MANFKYAGTVGGASPETKTFDVAAGTTASMPIGSHVTVANGYAALTGNGGGTTAGRYGLAVSNSNETSGAAGTVDVMFCPAGLILEGTATTPANLAAAVLFDKVTIDVSGTTQTVDENDTSSGGQTLYKFVGSDYTTTGKCQIVASWDLA